MLNAEIVGRMQQLHKYFESKAGLNVLFQPEADVAAAINLMIKNTSDFTEVEAVRLVAMLNSVEQFNHHDGCGWLDYKLHCRSLLRCLGFSQMAENIGC